MNQHSRHALVMLAAAGLLLALAPTAHADIPAGYQGKPFALTAGGAGIIPPSVQAGPYKVPGRIDFVNYDLGGDGVGFHTDAHYTTKGGDGYRTDRPTATLCLTATAKQDVFYGNGNAQDGMPYPTASTADFYVGSVHPNDWFNYTVDVQTAGMYTLSANFATGNGPPGGEGGDGQMELIISVNGTQQADWKATFPEYQTKANFHNWKLYPAFATLTLTAGLQVIKFQAPFKHLNLDSVQIDLVGAGGSGSGGAGAGGAVAAGGVGNAAGASGTSAAAAGSIESGGTGAVAGQPVLSAGSEAGGNSGIAGSAVAALGGAGATSPSGDASGCSCTFGKVPAGGSCSAVGALLGLALVARRRRARRSQI